MEVGAQITCINQEVFTIVKSMNEAGGQGSLWLVEDKNKQCYAFKKLKKDRKFIQKKRNIDKIIKENIHQNVAMRGKENRIKFMLPLKRTKVLEDESIGYIMNLAKGKSINSFLASSDIIFNIPLETKLKFLRQVVLSVDVLHSIGYCYADISWGNFMYDFESETLYVVDCDNIASQADIRSDKANFVSGTGFFVAPEVAFLKQPIDLNSEHYSLAVFIFRFLLNNLINSPYHGYILCHEMDGVMPQDTFDIAEAKEEYGLSDEWQYFIFDEAHSQNSLRRLVDEHYKKIKTKGEAIKNRMQEIEKTIQIWNQFPRGLKKIFQDTFVTPFNEHRPSTIQWRIAIEDALSSLKESFTFSPLQEESKNLEEEPIVIQDVEKPVRKPFVGGGELPTPQQKKGYKKFEGGNHQ